MKPELNKYIVISHRDKYGAPVYFEEDFFAASEMDLRVLVALRLKITVFTYYKVSNHSELTLSKPLCN